MRSFAALGLVLLCISSLAFQSDDYPKEWWAPVPKKDAASWEILPQEAGPGEVILSKRTELGVFSNFGATAFQLDGERFASVEGFWQMMKYPEGPHDLRSLDKSLLWPYSRDQVKQLVGFEAKSAGESANSNMKKLGINWITYQGQKLDYKGKDQGRHYDLIFAAIQAKILADPKLISLLLRTKGLKLRPDHAQDPKATPAYRYYDILMKIREHLGQKQSQF